MDSLLSAPDPREMAAPAGEIFRRQARARTLLNTCAHVDEERRAEIAREIMLLGPQTLPALRGATLSPAPQTAQFAQALIRLLIPDEIGHQICRGLNNEFGLEEGAVFLSRLQYPELSVGTALRELEDLGKNAAMYVYGELGVDWSDAPKAAATRPVDVIKKLGEFWRQEGFRGNTDNYYNDRNSYVPDALSRHTGLPITLSVIYIGMARRVHLRAEGVSLPGHFIVRIGVRTKEGEQFVLIDPFNGARPLDLDDCRRRVEAAGHNFVPEQHLRAAPTREILCRMCSNLLAVFDQQKKTLEAERVSTVLVHLQPRDPVPLLIRAERRLRRGERRGARLDFERARSLDPNGPVGRTAEELLRRMNYENPYR